MRRHLEFKNLRNLQDFLAENSPKHIYYSSAYYLNPSLEIMDEKGWLGADLIFDIDADHIPTKCKEEHDYWICQTCGAGGKGLPPPKCPKCGSEKIKTINWMCEKCLGAAKEQVERILDFLINDFNISEKNISIYFSGHRGFHIHVTDNKVIKLKQDSRREIVDYMKGIGLDPLRTENLYWIKRIIKFTLEVLSDNSLEDKRLRKIIQKIKNKDNILEELAQAQVSEDLRKIAKQVGLSTWKTLIGHILEKKQVILDERVTIDVKRLIRLPNSLHGKTGFKVQKLSIDELWDFNPLNDAKVFGDELISIKLFSWVPQTLFGYKLRKSEKVRLPLFLAVYVIGNGGATFGEHYSKT